MEVKYVILYVILINAIGFGMMALDKYKAQKGYWRVPEKSIFVVTLLRWWNRHYCRYVWI